MHGLAAGTAQFQLDAQVEIWRVDADKYVRLGGDQCLYQTFAA